MSSITKSPGLSGTPASSELTITRALAELKILDKRINSLRTSTIYLSVKIVGQAYKEHSTETKSNWQALTDLIKRYNKIKNAIISSNAVTQIEIAGTKYTVAEAISTKDTLKYKTTLLDDLRRIRSQIQNQVTQHTTNVQHKLDKLLELNFQKDKKVDENDIKAISEAYLKNNKIEVIDVLNIDKKITELETEIDNFNHEVDLVLSESNAVTKITI